MERIHRGVYTRELREEAVRLVTEGELSISEVGLYEHIARAKDLFRAMAKAKLRKQ